MPRPPRTDSTPKPRPSRGKSGKPPAPPVERAGGTPETKRSTAQGFAEAPQAPFLPGHRLDSARPAQLGAALAQHRRHDGQPQRAAGQAARALRARARGAGPAADDRRSPAGVGQPAGVHSAPAAAAREDRGRRRLQAGVGIRAQGRPAHRHRRAGRGRQQARARPGAARRHRLGQDLHRRAGDLRDPAPGPGAGAQQDAGGPALRRVQELLPRQRGRVLRLLLRLLPARSLRAAHRHLHREGIVGERADRPHAPRRHALAAGARRRHHRRVRVVHLRHRLGRDLHGHDLHGADRRDPAAAPAARRPGRPALPPQRRQLHSRHLPRARRHRRAVPGAFGRPRLAHLAVRRRGGSPSPSSIRSPARRPTS